MGDPRGGPVDLGPIDDVTDLTFKISVSPCPPCLSCGGVASWRVAPATVAPGGAPRGGPSFGLVV
jgi:hypothetical protein